MKQIDLNQIIGSMTFDEYLEGLAEALRQGKKNHLSYSDDLMKYAELNLSRMHRILKKANRKIDQSYHRDLKPGKVLILTEGWCGDAAQTIPWIYSLLKVQEDIEVKFIRRDENLEVMDAFLTNGGRSIPKLIFLDAGSQVLGSWGPRPSELQAFYMGERAKSDFSYDRTVVDLQKWYNKDKGESTIGEVLEILEKVY